MNVRAFLVPLAALLVLAAVPVATADPTYWNYSFVTVTVGGENHAEVGHTSCAGYGIEAPLVMVGSVPNPFEDCYEEPLTFEPIDTSDEEELVLGVVDRAVEEAGDAVDLVIGLIPDELPPGDGEPTYWNYSFFYVHVQDGDVEVGQTSCAGYGIPAPLVTVGSVPNPFEDCYKEPIILS